MCPGPQCAEPHGIALTNHEPSDPAELAYDVSRFTSLFAEPFPPSSSHPQMGDVIELIERIDRNWFFARNADLGMTEGAIPARDIRIVKGLPGENTVAGFEEGPCAVAMHTFNGGEQCWDRFVFSVLLTFVWSQNQEMSCLSRKEI